jgi:predicted nuclease of predicted toxin-antitoxin system
MTFWLDAHLDPELASWMSVRFNVMVKPLREIGLRDAEDVELYEAAQRFGPVVIMTKDADFSKLVQQRGAPPQVLWLRCGNLSTLELQALLSRAFPAALGDLQGGNALVEISGT